jgi:hypothetical protein
MIAPSKYVDLAVLLAKGSLILVNNKKAHPNAPFPTPYFFCQHRLTATGISPEILSTEDNFG